MNPTRRMLIDQLLEARRALQTADSEALQARLRYEAAEEAYLKESPIGGTPPDNVVVGTTAIMVADEWYDLKPGTRLEFHSVEIA
jgi:hypothetical protein